MSNNRISVPTLTSCAGAALLAASMSVPHSATAGASTQTLEEVLVTARKRTESLQDSPVVISALSERAINDFSIESVEDIADFTPGLVADTQGNSAGGILFLRGIGSGSGSPAIEQAVSLVIDDMQMGSLQMQSTAMIDMAGVQVFKGPQALFFGKNSPGGVLSIKTADPSDEFEANMKSGYEFDSEEWFVQGIVSGPFSDTAAGRLVVRYTEKDGYFDVDSGAFPDSYGGSAPQEDSVFARGTLILDPTDDLSIRTKLTYSDREGNVDGRSQIQRIYCPFGAPQLSQSFKCEANDTVQLVAVPQGAIDVLAAQGIDADRSGNLVNEQFIATIALDYDISNEFSLSSVTGYYDISDFQHAPGNYGLAETLAASPQALEFEQYTQELRLASDFDGPVNFFTGVYYEKKELKSNTTVPVDAQMFGSPVSFWVLGGVTEFVQDTESMSGFVDLTWNISDNLELSGGARYSWEEKEFNGISGYFGNEKEDWDDISPQITLSYHANDEWMLFASYREGFKSGGFDGAFQFMPRSPIAYEPESVEGFEAGAKGTLLDNTLQLNISAYAYEYDELQLSRFDPDTLSLSTFNAASADVNGIEADFIWMAPVDGLEVRGAVTFLDSQFTEFLAPCYTGQTPGMGCNQGFAGGQFNTQDLNGEPLTLAAEYVANLGLSYDREFAGLLLGLSMDAIYSDKFETGTTRAPYTSQDSYTKVDAAIGLSSLDETWSVSLIGRNLTDEHLISNGGSAPFTGLGFGTDSAILADSIAYVRPGRTFAVEFEYKFK